MTTIDAAMREASAALRVADMLDSGRYAVRACDGMPDLELLRRLPAEIADVIRAVPGDHAEPRLCAVIEGVALCFACLALANAQPSVAVRGVRLGRAALTAALTDFLVLAGADDAL